MTITTDSTEILTTLSTEANKENSAGPSPDWVEFDIHGVCAFRVERNSAISALFLDMFKPFLVQGLVKYDLTITEEFEPLIDGAYGEAHGESDFLYNEQGVFIATPDVQIFVDENGYRIHGKGELLVIALPIIDWIMVQKRAAMLHAMTVEYKGFGICMPAWGGSGKTSTMSKLMKIPGFAFMGDDWTFLAQSGDLLGFAKPMFMKPYHRTLYPHLFKKVHKPLVPNFLSKPIHSLTTRVHPYITRMPKLARFVRKWSPEHMMVQPEQAFPDAKISKVAPLAASLFVERIETLSTEPQFIQKDARWLTTKLIGNYFSELPRYSRLVMTTLGAAGLVPVEQSFREKEAILLEALAGKPAFYLRIPKSLNPDQASDIIVEKIKEVVTAAGID